MQVRSALDVGAVVRRRRREVGWSQLQLAEAVGVSRRWVTAFEQGKPSTELGIVLRTLAALGLTLDVIETTVAHGAVDLDDLLAEYDAD